VHGAFQALFAGILGSMALGVALTAFGLALWWGGPDRRLSLPALLGRAALSAASTAGILVGLYLLALGAEHLLGEPLRRWSGAHILPQAWLVLELLTREAAWTAAHARRAGHGALSKLGWASGVALWLAARGMLVLCLWVGLAMFLEL